MFRADFKIKLAKNKVFPKKRTLFQLPVAWFNGLIAQQRLVEVAALFR